MPQRALRPRPGFDGTGLYARLPLRTAPGPHGTHVRDHGRSREPAGRGAAGALRRPRAGAHLTRRGERLARDMRALPPTGDGGLRVLAGDFNATLDHAELRRPARTAATATPAEQAGGGLRTTWSTEASPLPPTVTIDHVLADRRVRVASARPVTIPGSDHRGVLAELVLPDADRGGG